MTTTEEFVAKFYNLNGTTIGEKRKNLFVFLNTITNTDQIKFAQLQPRNFLEEKLKIDLLLHYKKTNELIDVLKTERSLHIRRILKSPWFVEQLSFSLTATELVDTIFPNASFRTKVKILNKLANCLNDTDKAHKYFKAVDEQYGAYLASKLLPACSVDFVLNFLRARCFKPTPKQALTIVKRHPESTEEVIDILMKFDNAVEEYVNIFKYLKVQDTSLLFTINQQRSLSLRLGWRITNKYVKLHQDEIIANPKKYYRFLHNKQIAKTLFTNFNALYINLFPEDLEDFRYNCGTIISVFKKLPKNMRRSSLLVDNFRKLYGIDFWNSQFVSLEILDVLDADDRDRSIELAKKPENVLEAKWYSYLKTSKSLPLLKKQISLSSEIKTRAILVEYLVNSCKLNMDDAGLLDVCNYLLQTHRNDHLKVRKSFLSSIKFNYELEYLSEDVWKCINEFIAIFELNDEHFDHMYEFKKQYIRFRLLHNLPVDDQLVQWVRAKNTGFIIIPSILKLQLLCFRKFANIISEELKNEDLTNRNIDLLQSIINWNKSNSEKIRVLEFDGVIRSLKEKIAKNDYGYSEVKLLCALIKEEYTNTGPHELLNIYMDLSEKYGNLDIFNWLIKNDPGVIYKNIDAIVGILLMSKVTLNTYFFKYVKNYEVITEKIIDVLLKPYQDYEQENAITALSIIQNPNNFVDDLKPYYPTDVQTNPKTEEGRKLYALQGKITNNLKNLDPPSLSLSSILKFCKGDYLKLIRGTLYSICDNVNEHKLIPFLSELADQAVSIRKHALHLTFRVLDKNQVYAMIKQFMEKEKNNSVRKFIFKGCFNFFTKNPESFTWELVVLSLKAVDVDDTEVVNILLQFDRVPMEYRSKYVVLTWDTLHELPDPNNSRPGKLSLLLQKIPAEMICQLPQNFYDKIINNYFCKDSPLNLSFFGSHVNTFVCKYVLHGSSETANKERLRVCFGIVKRYILNSSVRPISCSPAIDFLKEFCLPFLNGYTDLELFEEFASLWTGFLHPREYFDEYLHLKLVALYVEGLSTVELGYKLAQLCESLVNEYGDVIVGMICNKIEFFMRYFFNSDDNERYDLIDSIINNEASISCLILGIMLLGNAKPSGKRNVRMYNEVIEKLEKFDDLTIKLYTYGLLSKNVDLYYKNDRLT